MLRVLVAEDSPTARALLTAILASDPSILLVGVASDGAEAVRMAKELRPDLITMDVHMPGVDGLGATREIMATIPTPILIVSSIARDDAALSLTATAAGALMVIPKPSGPGSPGFADQREYLLRMVHAMSQVKVVRRWRARASTGGEADLARPRPLPTAPRLIAIAASTGGPAAIRQILLELPSHLDLPILVVQHIARGFAQGLVDWLGGGLRLRVELAVDRAALIPGRVYVAGDDRHLGLRGDLTIELSRTPPIGQFRPSANYLFRSVASVVGGAAVGVILTGMGDDGVIGLKALSAADGYVIAQDEPTSVVYGMAREAVHAGVVNEILPIGDIAARLTHLTRAHPDG